MTGKTRKYRFGHKFRPICSLSPTGSLRYYSCGFVYFLTLTRGRKGKVSMNRSTITNVFTLFITRGGGFVCI